MRKKFTVFVILLAITACNNNQTNEIEYGTWLKGNEQFFTEAIERQFDGFSRTMMEVYYRYDELYWAGMDENWKYADYQLEHIVEAIEKGFERRPEHKDNSIDFLGAPNTILQQAIESKNPEKFNNAFILFNAACKSCHIKEDVGFIQTIIPEQRKNLTRFLNKDY